MTAGSPRGVAPAWLALGEASKVLGVDGSTLRAWTDAGRIRAYRTPGGHRRYRQDDLAAFLRGHQQERAGKLSDLIGPHGARLMPGAARREIRRQQWYARVGPETAETMRLICRRLMDALAGYLSGGRGQPVAVQAGEEAGRELGQQVAALHLSPAEATRAFLFFKESITQAVSSHLPLPSHRKVHSIRRIELFLDRVLLRMMAAYERGTSIPDSRS